MKTKEEIKQLAFIKYTRLINDSYNPMEDDNADERKFWINGYTQCQEDNKDKKYTEEDVRKCWILATNYALNQSDINLRSFINSLNKQN